MTGMPEVLAALDLQAMSDHRYRAGHMDPDSPVVFGGQILSQTIVAATRSVPAKEVLSTQTVFARATSPAEPLDLDVDILHQGSTFATATVTARQSRGVCAQSTVLLHAPDVDLITYSCPAPAVGRPDDCTPRLPDSFWDVRFADDVDIEDPELVGPPTLAVWCRFPDAPGDPVLDQALLAYATDGFLIGTAMRPHRGLGQALAHGAVATTVLGHSLSFHRPVDAAGWHLIANEATQSGRGRGHGRGEVFDEAGGLVASFVQDNMIRRPQAPEPR